MLKTLRGSFVCAAILATAGSASAESAHWRGVLPVGAGSALTAVRQVAPSELRYEQLSDHRFGDGDRIVHFGARYLGLPVLGGNASVRVDAAGKAREMYHPVATQWPASIVPNVDRAAAMTTLRPLSRYSLQDAHVHLGVFLRYGEARLAWFGFPTIPVGFPSRIRLVIDAVSGELIESVDLARSVTTARMYADNPAKTPTLAVLPLPIDEETPGSLSNMFLVAKNCVDNKTVKPAFGGQVNLHTCDLVNSVTLTDGNYALVPDDESPAKAEDPFSQLSMYYHSARAYAYFQGLQDSTTAQVVTAAPLTAIANLRLPQGAGFLGGGGGGGGFDPDKASDPDLPLAPFDNAFFSPGAPVGQVDPFGEVLGVSGGGMFFGQGAQRDYAYDGDVVYHEFTHAIVDQTFKLGQYTLDSFGVSAAPGAMNEGLADFFSSAISGDAELGEYAGAGSQGNGASIRNLVNDDTCGNSIVGESHADSTLFSGALWRARAQLAPAEQVAFDKSLYKSMRLGVQETPYYEDIAQLFLDGLQSDLPAAVPLLTAAFTEKGVLAKCTRVREQASLDAPVAARGDFPFFMAPATASVGLRRVPGVVQVHSKIAEGATQITVAIAQLFTYSQGGGNSRFEPKLAVRFGAAPIKWSVASTPKASADVQLLKLTPDENVSEEVEIEVPEGATEVYLQIVNDGQSDGVYESLGVVDDNAPSAGSSGGRKDGGKGASSGEDADAGASPSANGDGCGCHGAPARNVGGNLALLSVVAGLYAARRRRASR